MLFGSIVRIQSKSAAKQQKSSLKSTFLLTGGFFIKFFSMKYTFYPLKSKTYEKLISIRSECF